MKILKLIWQLTGAITGWFALGAQLYILVQYAGNNELTVAWAILRFLSFMTIWTNILSALSFTIPLIAPGSRSGKFFELPVVKGGILVYIIFVGIAYYLFLAKLWKPTRLQWWADILLHYVIPVYNAFYWILFVEKGFLKYKYSYWWLLYPLVYFVFALMIGATSGFYAYPFIDVSILGYAGVFKNALAMTLAYFILGLFLVLVDRSLKRK